MRVTTAAEAAARDHAAIASGVSGFALMLAAGTRSAEVILRSYDRELSQGVAVFAGHGNNGGDAYIMAAQMARAGVGVHLVSAEQPRSTDSQRAQALARAIGHAGGGRPITFGEPTGHEAVVVDGLLGTGHRDALRSPVAELVAQMAAHRARGAVVVALDVPSGLDATTGERAAGFVPAHLTVTFGTIKRGLLLSRADAGRIVLVDIGLGQHAQPADGAWHAADLRSLARSMPVVPWNAHKGQRGYLEIVGGGAGMAGAATLSTRAALAAGLGLARVCVHESNVAALQQAVPQAITCAWQTRDDTALRPPTALAIGPGLGRSDSALACMRAVLRASPRAPVVLDADALNMIAAKAAAKAAAEAAADAEGGDAAARLRAWCGDEREIVCTPHPLEFSRLTGLPVSASWEARDVALRAFASRARSTIVLKGAPTLVATVHVGELTTPTVTITVVARGNALLATGGSGDMLTGIIGSLLAQGLGASQAAIIGVSVHGAAAELAAEHVGGIRGLTLDDLLRAMPQAWQHLENPKPLPPGVLADLAAPIGAYLS